MYEYCIRNKLVDAALIAKWKKPGYERLCSTYVINTKNYKFGTVSICRVPKHALGADTVVEDPFTGCHGCASGPGGQRNIFGNKYGQYLAAIQVAREDERTRRQTSAAKAASTSAGSTSAATAAASSAKGASAEDADTDDEGPMPDTIWAVNEAERAMETVEPSAEAEGPGPNQGGGKRPRY